MSWFAHRNNYGKLMILIGAMIAIPLLCLPFYPYEFSYAYSFFFPSIASIAAGFIVCLIGKKEDETSSNWQHTMRTGSLTVLFAWLYAMVMGALPFIITGQLNVVQALFESVSGWTTTGLSVVDVTVTPHIFLLHRGFMQFCGGLGFIMVMILFTQGKQSMILYSSEGHPDQLTPNLKKTTRMIGIIYCGFLVVGTIAYIICGMEPLDSIVHAMASLSTGGFSNKAGSIGEYDSIPIEIITIILMLIGTTNFGVVVLLVKGKFKRLAKVSEVRFMCLVFLVAIPLIAISLFTGLYMNLGESFRRATFDSVSALSTTGFSSMSYADWPAVAIGLMIILMLIGGGIGSTAGGLKLTRVYLMFRIAGENIRKRISPSHQVKTLHYYRSQGKTEIDRPLIADTTGFIFCYLILFFAGSIALTWTAGCSFTEGMFDFASSLSTVGLSIGITGPSTNSASLIVEIFGMLLGRLEIFIVLIGIYSGISGIKQRIHRKHPVS